jgi:raffinose/stachyose/melibiose transport system permease protein
MHKKPPILSVIKHIAAELGMLFLCVIFFVPFYYLLVNTVKTAEEASFYPMALPSVFILRNYAQAFGLINFWSSLRNSLVITIISVVIIVLFGSLAAYPIVRRKKKWTKIVFFYFLLGFMVPVQVTMIPLFQLISNMKLQNSVIGMIVLYSGWCNFALFMYQGFLSTVPMELEESALIDGCSLWQVFWWIVFPLLKPVTITIVIFDTMWIWNDFILPYLFLSSSENFTLIMEVYKGVGQYKNNWAMMLCIMVIVLIPITVFYILMQKHIIAGITSGAVKG